MLFVRFIKTTLTKYLIEKEAKIVESSQKVHLRLTNYYCTSVKRRFQNFNFPP